MEYEKHFDIQVLADGSVLCRQKGELGVFSGISPDVTNLLFELDWTPRVRLNPELADIVVKDLLRAGASNEKPNFPIILQRAIEDFADGRYEDPGTVELMKYEGMDWLKLVRLAEPYVQAYVEDLSYPPWAQRFDYGWLRDGKSCLSW